MRVFIITILSDDEAPGVLRGRVRQVQQGLEATFISGDELLRLLAAPELGPLPAWQPAAPDPSPPED